MTKIVVSTEVENRTTRERDESDGWDIGDTEGYVSNVVAFIEREGDPSYYGDSHGKDLPDVKIGDTVYAVVADYESGCTFGRTGASGAVLDFFTDPEEAQALAEAALNKPEDARLVHNGVSYYCPWDGYFEYLQSLDVWACVVKGGPKDPWSDDKFPGFKTGR